MRLPDNHTLTLAAAVITACGLGAPAALAGPANGPSADFPVVLGESYSVGSTVFTPADVMNIDAVGHVSVAQDGNDLISAAHHTLPLPSYVEVTSLESGRTILVRVDKRGPMDSTSLIQLSGAAAAQLGVGENAPVRVRRVNPPEPDRALLRAGAQAPERMPTPKALLAVLSRKLDANDTVSLARAAAPLPAAGIAPALAAAPAPVAAPTRMAPPPARPLVYPTGAPMIASAAATSGTQLPRLLAHGGPKVAAPASAPVPVAASAPAPVRKVAATRPTPAPFSQAGASYAGIDADFADLDPPRPAPGKLAAAPARKPAPPRPAAKPVDIVAEAPVAATTAALRSGMLVVQAGAFAMKGNAQQVAGKLGATVQGSGKVWRVRMGPYSNRAQAEAALAKVHAAGYSEARIQHAE